MKFSFKRPEPSAASQFRVAERSYAIKGAIESIGDWLAQQREWVVAIMVVALAGVLRLFQLARLPAGLHPDEARHGIDALSVLSGDIQPFFEGSGDALLSILQALSVALLGETMLALRIVPALIGILAVWMTYLAARNWLSHRVGLIAALLMATSPWAVQVSRLSLSAVLLTLLIPLLAWTVHKAITTNKAAWYLVSGVTLGIGIYADIIFLIIFAAVASILVFAWFNYRDKLIELKQPIIIMLLSMTVVLLPLLFFLFFEGAQYIERGITSRISEDYAAAVQELPEAALDTALMLHFNGDRNYLHNLRGQPQLNALVGILLILGTMLCIRRFKDIRYAALLALSVAMMLPSVLALDESPHALLSAGAIPPLMIIAGVGLSELYMRWRGVFPRNPLPYHAAMLAIIVVVTTAATYDIQRYFIAWANAPQSFQVHREELMATANYINENPIEGRYIVALDEGNDMAPVDFIATQGAYQRIPTDEITNYDFLPGDILLIPQVHEDSDLQIDLTRIDTQNSVYRPQIRLLNVFATDSE